LLTHSDCGEKKGSGLFQESAIQPVSGLQKLRRLAAACGIPFAAAPIIMPRRRRYGMAGIVFHVMNRGARRGRLFETSADYERFITILREAVTRRPIRLLTFSVMPTHFHFLAQPETDAQLPRFMHWFTTKHAIRWRTATQTLGEGAVYQARYKAIPVQTEEYFLRVARYVERNALRARLVDKAEDWKWCSLWHREIAKDNFPLAQWPVQRPNDWVALVNQPQTAGEVAAIKRAINRGCAFGNASWQEEIAKTLAIPGYFRSRGRPRCNDS
jgi:putative transposase